MTDTATPRMDVATFDGLFNELRNWGRWGEGDEQGCLNFLTPDVTAAASALVRTGQTVSLANDLDFVAGPDNARPALHYMSQLGDADEAEPRVNLDFIGFDYHGKSISHLDALCHCVFRGRLYGDVPAAGSVTSQGGAFGNVLTAGAGIVGRGVLLDIPRGRGVEWLEPGEAVDPEELDDVARAQGTAVGRGDIVLFRTGHRRRREALAPWDPSNSSAGLYPTALRWLHERDVSILGSDGDNDARPSPVDGIASPIHALAIVAMGLLLVDNLDLERLADACAAAGRWEFLCVVAPLRIPGGTGSPVNPIAVF